MQVTLSNPDLERFVLEQVKQGAFPSASAMLEAAVARMMMEAEPLSPEDRAAIAVADAEIERGKLRSSMWWPRAFEQRTEPRLHYHPRKLPI